MADCGGDTYVWSEGESLYRCVPVGFAVLDPVKGCVYQPSRPLTCVSARIGPGEFGCNNGVLYPDGTLGFVSFTNTNCPLFDLPSGAVEQPNANPDKYPACAAP